MPPCWHPSQATLSLCVQTAECPFACWRSNVALSFSSDRPLLRPRWHRFNERRPRRANGRIWVSPTPQCFLLQFGLALVVGCVVLWADCGFARLALWILPLGRQSSLGSGAAPVRHEVGIVFSNGFQGRRWALGKAMFGVRLIRRALTSPGRLCALHGGHQSYAHYRPTPCPHYLLALLSSTSPDSHLVVTQYRSRY